MVQSTSDFVNQIAKALETKVHEALQGQLQLTNFIEPMIPTAVNPTNNGTQAVFSKETYDAPNVDVISETVDPSNSEFSDVDQVIVTTSERGEAFQISKRVVAAEFTTSLIPRTGAKISRQLGSTKNFLIEEALNTTENVIATKTTSDIVWLGNGTVAAAAGEANGPITSDAVRTVVTELQSAFVPKINQAFHAIAFAHPKVINQVRTETGNNSFRVPAEYQDIKSLISPEATFVWEDVLFVPYATNPVKKTISSTLSNVIGNIVNPDGDYWIAGTDDEADKVYRTYFVAADALVKHELNPGSIGVDGITVDKLARFLNFYWKLDAGYGILHPEAVWSVYSTANGITYGS